MHLSMHPERGTPPAQRELISPAPSAAACRGPGSLPRPSLKILREQTTPAEDRLTDRPVRGLWWGAPVAGVSVVV